MIALQRAAVILGQRRLAGSASACGAIVAGSTCGVGDAGSGCRVASDAGDARPDFFRRRVTRNKLCRSTRGVHWGIERSASAAAGGDSAVEAHRLAVAAVLA